MDGMNRLCKLKGICTAVFWQDLIWLLWAIHPGWVAVLLPLGHAGADLGADRTLAAHGRYGQTMSRTQLLPQSYTLRLTTCSLVPTALAMGLCVAMIAFVRLPSLKVSCLLLSGLLIYDVFWVRSCLSHKVWHLGGMSATGTPAVCYGMTQYSYCCKLITTRHSHCGLGKNRTIPSVLVNHYW